MTLITGGTLPEGEGNPIEGACYNRPRREGMSAGHQPVHDRHVLYWTCGWTEMTRTQRAVHVAIIIVALVISARLHQMAGSTFPPPWSDETSYLWPAISVARHNTLFTPQQNPDRHVHWMPPGYALTMGLVFKLTGVSLEAARWFSWTSVALSFVVLAVFFSRYPLPLLSTCLLSLFFLSGTFVTLGNIGRMDGLLLLMAVVAFALLQIDRPWPAVVLAGVSPLVHPNGAYFAAGAVAWLIYDRGFRWGTPSRLGWAAIAGAVLAWSAYAAYVLRDWTYFRSDMSVQFSRPYQSVAALVSPEAAQPIAWFVVLGVVAMRVRPAFVLPLTFGGCSFLILLIRRMMWYQVFHDLAFLILGLVTIWLAATLLERRKLLAGACVTVLVLSLLTFYHRGGFIDGPRGYPRDMVWYGAVMETDGVPYVTDDDLERVKAEVARHLTASATTRVSFYPAGDTLFFLDAWANAEAFQARFTDVRPHLLVARTSRYIPTWQDDRLEHTFGVGLNGRAPFHQRDGTERWYLVDLRVKPN